MCGMSGVEMVVVLVVAIVVIGPEKLPTVLRTVARTVGELRGLTDEIRSSASLLDNERENTSRSATRRRSRSSLAETEIDLVKARKTAAARREAAANAAELPVDPSPTAAEESGSADVLFRREDLDAPARPLDAGPRIRPADGAVARGAQPAVDATERDGGPEADPPPLAQGDERGGVS